MKKKYLLWGVCILGLCVTLILILNREGIFHQEDSSDFAVIVGEDNVIIGEEQDEIPLADTDLNVEDSYAVLQEMLSKVPANVINRFYADHWGFSLTSDNLSNRFFGGAYAYVRAVTEKEKKTIWMAQNDDAIRLSAVHELGHYVDLTLGWPHESDEFIAIFREDKYVFDNLAQSSTSPVEYFAEAFQQTILHPEFVEQNAPMTYAYMTSLIRSF